MITEQEAIYKLKDHGVSIIYIEYSGGGDSGAIDDISYYDKNDNDLTIDVDADIVNAIDKLAYRKLHNIEDWWNNEGGSGVMKINIDDLTYHVNNEIRMIEYENFTHGGSLSELLED